MGKHWNWGSLRGALPRIYLLSLFQISFLLIMLLWRDFSSSRASRAFWSVKMCYQAGVAMIFSLGLFSFFSTSEAPSTLSRFRSMPSQVLGKYFRFKAFEKLKLSRSFKSLLTLRNLANDKSRISLSSQSSLQRAGKKYFSRAPAEGWSFRFPFAKSLWKTSKWKCERQANIMSTVSLRSRPTSYLRASLPPPPHL